MPSRGNESWVEFLERHALEWQWHGGEGDGLMAGLGPDVCRQKNAAHLPAGLEWETGDGHPVDSAARAWSHARLVLVALTWTGATTSELDDEALAHELGAI